jgi:hypothetical protein
MFYEVEMRHGMLSVPAGLFADPAFQGPETEVFDQRAVAWCNIDVRSD